MDPDKYQQAWQAEASQTQLTVASNLLLQEVRRNQRAFRAMILRRDVVESSVGLGLLPVWIYLGTSLSLPWTWYLMVPALLWVMGFFLVDRLRHKQTPAESAEPLLETVKGSLAQVEHQIWLLRNVFWWYLLPFTISIMTFVIHLTWLRSKDWWDAFIHGGSFAFIIVLYAFIDYINQCAVCSSLEPRREELLALLAGLGGDDLTEERTTMDSVSTSGLSRILGRWATVSVLTGAAFAALTLAGGTSESNYQGPPRSSGPGGDSLAKLVSGLRKEKRLVSLAAMVMVNGKLEAAAAQGERKIGSDVAVEIGDLWHLGGITKSITATMIARLIELGQMRWSDTVGEIFSEASIHEEWKPVTLKQLLTDTAGAPASFPSQVMRQRPSPGPERTQARREAVLNVISQKPAYPPGTNYAYSNVGYTIAGAMAEKVTGATWNNMAAITGSSAERADGATWEELVKREVFEPLKLTQAGFGPPKSSNETLEQPRGHLNRLGGKFPVDDQADNTPIMGPAGTVHMTLHDLCTYANEHLRGDRGEGKLLSAETYRQLHTPELKRYACGWVKKEPSAEIPHTVYWHNGSNTMWYALVAFIPETNMVVAVSSNDGDVANTESAAWEIVKASVQQFTTPAVAKPR